jgi:hypothetical protein
MALHRHEDQVEGEDDYNDGIIEWDEEDGHNDGNIELKSLKLYIK